MGVNLTEESIKNEENLFENEMNQKGQFWGGRGLLGLRVAAQNRIILGFIGGGILGTMAWGATGALIGAIIGILIGALSYVYR